MKVSEIMNKAVVAGGNISLKEAAKIMSEKNIGSLIIAEKDKIIGIITERDVLKNVDRTDKKIYEIMSRNVVIIRENESLEDAAELMAKNKIKRLPVVKNGKLAGIITATDILANSDELSEDFYYD